MSRRFFFSIASLACFALIGCGKKAAETPTADTSGGASSPPATMGANGGPPPGMMANGPPGGPQGGPQGGPGGMAGGPPPGMMANGPPGGPQGGPGGSPMPGGMAGGPPPGMMAGGPQGGPQGGPGGSPMPGGMAGGPPPGMMAGGPQGGPQGGPGGSPMPGGYGPQGGAPPGMNPMGFAPNGRPMGPSTAAGPGAGGFTPPMGSPQGPMGSPPGPMGSPPGPMGPMGSPPGPDGSPPVPGGAPGVGVGASADGSPPGSPMPGAFPGAPGGGSPPGPGGPGAFPGAPGGPGGFPGAPGAFPGAAGQSPGATAPAEPKTLEDFVRLAIAQGQDKDAYQLLYADAIAGGKSLENMKWYSGIRRNSPAIRFGVGIMFSGSRAVASPEPIGSTASNTGGGGAPGMMPGGPPGGPGGPPGGPGGPGTNRNRNRNQGNQGNRGQNQNPGQPQAKPELFKAPEEPRAMLAFYTGELGDKVLANLKKRFEKGDFGATMKDMSKVQAALPATAGGGQFPGAGGPPGAFPGAPGGPGGPGGPGSPPGGPGGPGAPGGAFPGAPGGAIPGGPGSPPGGPGGPGGFPGAMPGAMPGGPGAAAAVAPANGDQLLPGVFMLGEGKQNEIVKKAAEEGIDVVILYDVEVTKAGQNVVNTTKISFINVATKEVIYSGASLTNGLVAKAREDKKKNGDPVEAEMEKMFGMVDEKLVGGAFPANAKPEKVATFVDKLADGKPANPLPALAEIRFFRSKELITSEKMIEAYGKLLGAEVGPKVASGDPAEVLASLGKWLPEKRPASLVPGGEGGEKKGGIFGKLFGK